MADAEHRRLCEPREHQLIEARLRRLVHRGGRLVEEEPVGLLDQDPRESDPLLLARGELERPARGLVEAPGELREPHGLERLAQRRIVDAPAGIGKLTTFRSVPIGRYGRCGRKRIRASSAARTSPRPNGQMPAMARTSVLFPEPDAPPSSTVSPRKSERLTFAMSG
jgi:hypothetical protein